MALEARHGELPDWQEDCPEEARWGQASRYPCQQGRVYDSSAGLYMIPIVTVVEVRKIPLKLVQRDDHGWEETCGAHNHNPLGSGPARLDNYCHFDAYTLKESRYEHLSVQYNSISASSTAIVRRMCYISSPRTAFLV